MPSTVLRVIGAAAALLLAGWLWNYWSSICNEACSPARSTSMIFLSAALPASLWVALVEYTRQPPRTTARRVCILAVAVFVMAAATVSFT
jgi:hypothetical protein